MAYFEIAPIDTGAKCSACKAPVVAKVRLTPVHYEENPQIGPGPNNYGEDYNDLEDRREVEKFYCSGV